MQNNGDNLTKKCPIDHWVYFKTQEEADKFIVSVEIEYFLVPNREQFEYPFAVHLVRVDYLEVIDDITDFLLNEAEKYNGEYDGWETPIVKSEDSE